MKVENLCKVFEKFKTDNNRAILVDGPWGVGKTYQILQFLKKDPSVKNKKENTIVYVSLFGKTTIDEIHTDIYSKLHPIKNGAKKLVQVIPKVAPLLSTVGDMISNMEFALNADETKINSVVEKVEKASQDVEKMASDLSSIADIQPTVRKSKNRTIVIFDDLERIDSEKMPFRDILGYINNLFLQNIKVIVICNSKEIKGDAFISFKEKVFDREYKISATDNQIITSYFGDASVFLKDYIIDEFDNNLRIALRTSNFYAEVIKQFSEYNEKYFEKISNETILYYCALVVVGCNSKKYIEAQEKDGKKKHSMLVSSDDEHIQMIAQSIYDYLINKDDSQHINTRLIFGLLEGYYFNIYDRLTPIFVESTKYEDPFLVDPFCFSDDEKRALFTKQFEKIKNDSNISDRSITTILNSMCQYEELSDINCREDEIIDNILNKCNDKDVIFLLDYPYRGCQRFVVFRERFKTAYKHNEIRKMIKNLKNSYVNKKYAELCDCLRELDRGAIFVENKGLNSEIVDIIKSNKFFIDDLSGTIEVSQWEAAHIICEIAVRYNFAEDVITFIRSKDYGTDQSTTERYMFLLKNKLSDNSK